MAVLVVAIVEVARVAETKAVVVVLQAVVRLVAREVEVGPWGLAGFAVAMVALVVEEVVDLGAVVRAAGARAPFHS